jgi:spoIIIJ-associated protein
MDQLHHNVQKLIELMGFGDFSVSYDPEGGRFSIFINDEKFLRNSLADFVADLEHLVKLMAKKTAGEKPVFVDVNNYRKERENLILELARAAARKAAASKQEVDLPAMNAYERRLVHLELASRPDIKTESVGERRERHVVVRPI